MVVNATKNSVRERLDSAVTFLRANGDIERVSIAELCRIAGVSRANIYSNHKDFLEGLEGRSVRRSLEFFNPTPTVISELDALRQRVKALQYITLELSDELKRQQLHNQELRAELAKRTLRPRK